MNRRGFLKGALAVTAGAIILPATLEENAEAVRRYWALDQSMVPQVWDAHVQDRWTTGAPYIDIYLYQAERGQEITLRIDKAAFFATNLFTYVPDDIRSAGGRPTAIAWRPGGGAAPWVQDLTGAAPGRGSGPR